MSDDLVRASDDDRERAITELREHLAAGRLTLEEFTERMSTALATPTTADLHAPLRELPVSARTRRRPTRFLLALFGSTDRAALDVYVPEEVEVGLHGLTVFGHKDAQGGDVEPLPGTPLVPVYAFGVFCGMDVWRVPLAWAKRTLRQAIKGIEHGDLRELEA